MTPLFILLLLVCAWYAWRYSRAELDPDMTAFTLQAFTGARYGKDFADCKTPGIHWWFLLITKVVGKSVPRVKFANTFLVSLPSLAILYYTGNFWAGLAFIILVNSGWLIGFHGNVGQVPAGLFAMALIIPNPWISAV